MTKLTIDRHELLTVPLSELHLGDYFHHASNTTWLYRKVRKHASGGYGYFELRVNDGEIMTYHGAALVHPIHNVTLTLS